MKTSYSTPAPATPVFFPLTATCGAVQCVYSTISDATIQAIIPVLNGLQFDQMTVIVQDGRVMQIDRTERRRLTPLDQ